MLKTFPKTFCYAWRKQWWLILLVVAALLWCAHVFWCHILPSMDLSNMGWWNVYWNAVAGVLTLLVAVMLWWNDMERQRRETLPKRLDVEFREDNHAGRVVLRCDNAIISAAGDERAFAQQIGAQMCGGVRILPMEVAGLHFEYLGLQEEGKNEHHHYLIRIPLRMSELKEELQKAKIGAEKEDKTHAGLKCLGQHWVVDAQGGIDKSKRLF